MLSLPLFSDHQRILRRCLVAVQPSKGFGSTGILPSVDQKVLIVFDVELLHSETEYDIDYRVARALGEIEECKLEGNHYFRSSQRDDWLRAIECYKQVRM